MKKVLFLCGILSFLMMSVGCDNTTKLTCTYGDPKDKQILTFSFNGEEATTITARYEFSIDSEEQIDSTKQAFEEIFKEEPYKSGNVDVKGKNITAIGNVDVSKLKVGEEEDAMFKDLSYDSIKKKYEAEGYTCK